LKIIERYIVRELLLPFSVVAAILIVLYVSFISASLLAGGVTESLGVAALVKLILLKTLIALEVLMPISLYVAVVMGLGRLYRDQEISVLRSAGVSENRITHAVLLVAIPIGIASGVISIFLRPWAYAESYIMNAQAEAELNTDRFQAGRFYGSERKGRVVYIGSKDDSGRQMNDVFHYVRKDGISEIIFAKEARQQEAGGTGQRPQVDLSDGFVYRIVRDGTKDTVVQFEKLAYFTDSGSMQYHRRKAAPTETLFGSDRPKDIAELQWRISRPLATVLLALIAVPFSRSPPRREKGEKKIFAAALVFAIYYILSGLAQTWVEQGTIGRLPGVWWLYALMLVVAIVSLTPLAAWKRLLRR
jgi:lipopolysaccharide export system permease protein